MQQPERDALSQIVDSVADGASSLDWDAIERRVSSDDERALVRQLRILARISDVHRSAGEDQEPAVTLGPKVIGRIEPVPAPSPRPTPRTASGEVPPRQTPARWGHLQLVEKVGEGAFGEVYRAFDTQLHREVALKLLKPEKSPGRLAQRILREGRILARLRHPNVVVVHGVESRDGRVGLWMELIRGATLEKLVKKQGSLSAREAALIGQDLCRAMAAVHGAGLVHRDIKAQNVMREEGGRIVLMDFGAGRSRDERPTGGSRLTGTPLYLAPEILNGGDASIRSDIYSLGVLLYFLVTGDYPVKAGTLDALVEAHAASSRIRLHDARPDLPDGFVRVVERALQVNPSERFSSTGEFSEGLQAAFDLRSRESESAHAFSGRWPVWMLTAMAGLSLAMVAALLLLSLRDSPRLARPQAFRSVAVIPQYASNDESHRALADGLAEGVMQLLIKADALNVSQGSSVARVAGHDAGAALTRLGVDAVVMVSVSPANRPGPSGPGVAPRTALSIRVVDARGKERLRTAFENVEARAAQVQRDAALAIVQVAGVSLTPAEREFITRPQVTHAEADRRYWRGVRVARQRTEPALLEARQEFEGAIAIDSRHAASYAALSETASLLRGSFGIDSPQMSFSAARGAADMAIDLDPTSPAGHTARAWAAFYLGWQWQEAEAGFRRAIALQPGYSAARHYYSDFLSAVGRPEEALKQAHEAVNRDPGSLVALRGLAWIHFFSKQYASAEIRLEEILSEDPDNVPAQTLLARTYAQIGRGTEGASMLEKLVRVRGLKNYGEKLAYVYAVTGRRAEAEALLTDLVALKKKTYIKPYDLALVCTALDRREEALMWLDQAHQERDSTLVNLKVDHRFDSLRRETRFSALMARMAFP